MKRIARLALVILMATLVVLAIASCGNKQKSGEISVNADAMPQLVHVLGEELDLSNGMLNVNIDGESREIPLNAEGVTVSGYDKGKLGEQTVTVSYEGFTTTVTVTVVERMRVEDAVTEYLAGDALDLTRGRVKIYRNDGTNFTAIFNSDKVTVSGFDGGKAGTQTLEVVYKSGDTEYSCDYTVTVYAVDSITLKAPNKSSYNSHDSGIILTGGSIVMSGNGGKLVRELALDGEGVTVSGFDLSAVNETNTPLKQTVSVDYKGDEVGSFKLTLNYTDVSMFKDNAKQFAAFDFSGATLPDEMSEQLNAVGELGLDLMELYLNFSPAERSYVTEEECLAVARASFIYGVLSVQEDMIDLEGGFTILRGSLSLTCETREGVEKAVIALSDTDSDLYRISDLLLALSEEFENTPLLDDGNGSVIYFGSFAFADTATYLYMRGILEHMLDVDKMMSLIPADYVENGEYTYSYVLESIYSSMFGNSYVADGWGQIYAIVDAWGAEVDVIDMMYDYYLFDQQNYDAIGSLTYVRFPSTLDELVIYIATAMDELDMLNGQQIADSSWLLYYYYSANRLANIIKTGEDTRLQTYYLVLPVNGLLGINSDEILYIEDMLDYLRNVDGGVYYYAGGLLGTEGYQTLVESYINILDKLYNDPEYFESAQYGSDLDAMLLAYLDLSPMQQYLFISALCPYYSTGELPLAFDDANPFYAELIPAFVTLINDHYRTILGENAAAVYDKLIVAIELYSQRFYEGSGTDAFINMIKEADALAAALVGDDATAFESSILNDVLDEYLRIAALHDPANKPSDLSAYLGTWEGYFLELQDALINVEIAYYYNSLESGIVSYTSFISAFERAARIYSYIEDNAPANIVDALHHLHVYTLVGEEDDGELYGSFDYTFNTYRGIYVYYLLTVMEGGIYDSYVGSGLQSFLEECGDLLWPYFWYLFDTEAGESATLTFDTARALEILNSYCRLSSDEQVLFMIMEGQAGYYYAARQAFVDNTYGERVASVVKQMFKLEDAVLVYSYVGSTESLDELKNALGELKTLYSTLIDEAEVAEFTPFAQMYADCVANAEQLILEATTPAPDGTEQPAA